MTVAATIDRLVRILAALDNERAIPPEDAAALAGAIRGAIAGTGTIEARLQLTGQWRAAWRRRDLVEALMLDRQPEESSAKWAERIAAEITRYHASGFSRDLAVGEEPPGIRGALHRLLLSNGNRPPSKWTVRDWLREAAEQKTHPVSVHDHG